MRRIRELYWRPDRVEHIYERHGITVVEVEEAVLEDRRGRLFRIGPARRDPRQTVYEHYGRTRAGRYLLVVLIFTGGGVAMPVTAREMTDGERSTRYG